MRQYTPEPRPYELMTVLSPDVAEADIPGMLDRIGGYLTDAGGTVTEVLRDSPWGRRRLAYPIRHAGRDLRDGFYTVYHFDLAPSQVTDVERELKLNDQIIRYLLVQFVAPPVDEKAVEAAEIAAENAAAEAYAAAQQATTAENAPPEAAAPSAPAPAPTATAAPESAAPETTTAPAGEPTAEATVPAPTAVAETGADEQPAQPSEEE